MKQKTIQPTIPSKPHAMTIILSPDLHMALLKRTKIEGRKPAAMARRILEEVLMAKGR
jgi:hypothetical protein